MKWKYECRVEDGDLIEIETGSTLRMTLAPYLRGQVVKVTIEKDD